MKRRSRAEANESNRRAVLDAARRQFEIHGFHGASLDDIAEDAGFSKGAVYSRFESKADVFLAVLEDHIERRASAAERQLESFADDADFVDVAKAFIGASVATVAWQAALLEFRSYAWRHPEVNARYAELHRRTIAGVAAVSAAFYGRLGESPPIAPEQIALVGLASGTGVVAEFMADPDLDVDGLVAAIVNGLASAQLVETEEIR